LSEQALLETALHPGGNEQLPSELLPRQILRDLFIRLQSRPLV